jgi:hypothetical protein
MKKKKTQKPDNLWKPVPKSKGIEFVWSVPITVKCK